MSFISSGLSRYLAVVPAAVTAMLSAALLPAAPAQADASFWMQGVQAEVRVISAFTATGETETTVPLGLEFQMNEGWHIYWRTPGEAGLPPELDHGSSLNVAETAFSWPVPTRDVTYGIETFVYKDRVVLPLEVSLQNPGEPLDLRGKVDFLICADVCIPDSVEVDFSLPGGAAEIAEGEAALLNTFETRIPADNSGGVGLQVESIAFEAASDPDNPLLVGYLDTRLASVFEMTAPDVFAEVPEGFSVRQPEVALSDDAMMAQALACVPGEPGPGDAGHRSGGDHGRRRHPGWSCHPSVCSMDSACQWQCRWQWWWQCRCGPGKACRSPVRWHRWTCR